MKILFCTYVSVACPGGCIGCPSTPLASALHIIITGSMCAAAFSKSSYRRILIGKRSHHHYLSIRVFLATGLAASSLTRPPLTTRRRFQRRSSKDNLHNQELSRAYVQLLLSCQRKCQYCNIFIKQVPPQMKLNHMQVCEIRQTGVNYLIL